MAAAVSDGDESVMVTGERRDGTCSPRETEHPGTAIMETVPQTIADRERKWDDQKGEGPDQIEIDMT